MAKKTAGVTYLVALDPGSGRWNVTRDGIATGAFARDRETAIGQAFADASREAHQTKVSVTVWVVDKDGKRTKEWESPRAG